MTKYFNAMRSFDLVKSDKNKDFRRIKFTTFFLQKDQDSPNCLHLDFFREIGAKMAMLLHWTGLY